MEMDFDGFSYHHCRRPPKGWKCSGGEDHAGPCAAVPTGWRKLYWMVRLNREDALDAFLFFGLTVLGCTMFTVLRLATP